MRVKETVCSSGGRELLSLVMFLAMYLHPFVPVVHEPPPPPPKIVQVSRSTPQPRQFEITAYDLSFASTGKRPGDRGYGITASGATVTPQHTIAADWSVLPKGTKVRIEGFENTFVVQDTGGAIKGNRIDIYMPSYNDCISFGRQKLFVTVVK